MNDSLDFYTILSIDLSTVFDFFLLFLLQSILPADELQGDPEMMHIRVSFFAVGNAESYDIIGDINAKRNVDVYRRNVLCVRMTCTPHQECEGIFEEKNE